MWLQGRRLITSQLQSHNRLSTPLVVRCAATQAVNSDVVQTEEKFMRHNTDSNAKSFLYTFVGFGAGLIIGAILKTHYDERTRSKKPLTHILPSVSAASPFSFSSVLDENNNEILPPETVSKRVSYNFIADAVEKASDKVVYIDIKDVRRYVCLSGHMVFVLGLTYV